jgi:hypothetical protein
MDQSAGHMKHAESKDPQYEEHQRDCPKHLPPLWWDDPL